MKKKLGKSGLEMKTVDEGLKGVMREWVKNYVCGEVGNSVMYFWKDSTAHPD